MMLFTTYVFLSSVKSVILCSAKYSSSDYKPQRKYVSILWNDIEH